MQQSGPQFTAAGSQAPGTGAFGQQTFSHPAQHAGAQGFGQPFPQAAQPPGQQQFGAPGHPQGQPPSFFPQQPQGYPVQPQPQPQPQPQAQPGQAAQAAPVAPVPFPSYAPSSGYQGQQQGAQQSPQQAMARQLTSIARVLEQLIPGYQILISVLQDAARSPKGQELSGAQHLLDTLKETTYHHYGALGAIRRFLVGETSSEVFAALARSVTHLNRINANIGPKLDQVVQSAGPDLRSTLSGLHQAVSQSDALLAQAISAVKGTVGQQVWDQCSGAAE